MDLVDLDVTGASRQMEKCDECRKGNVKQRVCNTHPQSKCPTSSTEALADPVGCLVYTSWPCLARPKV